MYLYRMYIISYYINYICIIHDHYTHSIDLVRLTLCYYYYNYYYNSSFSYIVKIWHNMRAFNSEIRLI